MPDKIFEPSSDEYNTALNGLTMQAKHFGLDITNPNLHKFILHEANVISSLFAETRFLNNLLDKETLNVNTRA